MSSGTLDLICLIVPTFLKTRLTGTNYFSYKVIVVIKHIYLNPWLSFPII